MIRNVQYVAAGLFIVMFFEGMLTFGTAFNFKEYNAFAWIAQGVIVTFAVTTALRIAKEEI
jgi:hypothetical protein